MHQEWSIPQLRKSDKHNDSGERGEDWLRRIYILQESNQHHDPWGSDQHCHEGFSELQQFDEHRDSGYQRLYREQAVQS